MQAPRVDYEKMSRTGNTAEIFSRSEIYFFFPRRKQFLAALYPNLKLFQSFYETMRETSKKLQEFPTSYSTKSS